MRCRDPLLTQIQLFDQFILPASELFFSQVETHAVSNFYPTLVMITREALVALREELADN
ncbi:Chaperone protein YcdY [Arsenophonus nasoniae]|nr:Chaperone protein YcdY [Arsenophonus nasoniae]